MSDRGHPYSLKAKPVLIQGTSYNKIERFKQNKKPSKFWFISPLNFLAENKKLFNNLSTFYYTNQFSL
jgi:hypothetical protein